MEKKKIKEVMSWLGKKKSKKKADAVRRNLEKARKKRWPKKTLDKEQ